MKLQNKKTGEIGTPRVDYQEFYIDTKNGYTYNYKSLQRMYEDWEDAPEEPKGIIKVEKSIFPTSVYIEYSTEEEAEKALEKLKAFTRLKDKGFRFMWVDKKIGSVKFGFFCREGKITKEMWQDIDTCFGGEEDA